MKIDLTPISSNKLLANQKGASNMEFWTKQSQALNIHQVVIITTLKENGKVNAAPKSWHMPCCDSPNMFAFACGEGHHTYENILRTNEFAVNYPLINDEEKVWRLNKKYNPDQDELEEVGLSSEKPKVINTSTIKECPLNYECRLVKIIDFYKGMSLIIGEVVAAHIDQTFANMDRQRANPFIIDQRNSYFYLSR